MSLKNNCKPWQKYPRWGWIANLALMFLLCFCGSDQEKSKKNPQTQPPESGGTPVEPPGDWDGLQDWTGSVFKILEE